MSSNIQNNATGSNRQDNGEGASFPQFPDLVPELRTIVWRLAAGGPRLIYVQVGVPGFGAFARFDRFVMNRSHLAEITPGPGVLHTSHESRHEALAGARRDASAVNWLGMLGILEFRPNGSDLVYLGGLRDGGQRPPADMDRIIPLSLVLGNVLPRVCVNGDVFARHFARGAGGNNPDEENQPHPVEQGLASLRAHGTQFAPLFADAPNGLPGPTLPESMVFMLDNLHLRWDIVSPCTDPGHTQPFIISCCIHYDHLEIVADGNMDVWMDANLGQYDAERADRIRNGIVPSIRAVWAGWRGRPDVAAQVPRLFFARIRPADPVPADGEGQDQEA